MIRGIRYTLAALFFAASVGCLALWWRSNWYENYYGNSRVRSLPTSNLWYETNSGLLFVGVWRDKGGGFGSSYHTTPIEKTLPSQQEVARIVSVSGRFGLERYLYYFPLWYPALVFALAGVGVLRFRRQFSIRSAIITVSVVAVLLGIIVAL